jgi:ubiquinone/menaquinone biosynthesis C-methylase UbiE
MIERFEDLFWFAMDRDVPRVLPMPEGIHLNVGAGNKKIDGAIPLDYPDWNGEIDPLPFESGSVSGIHAYHFLEHISDPVRMLQEFQRVLKIGGVVNICVPYYNSQMFAHDLDHKHAFCEETWKILFNNPYYNKNRIEWKFKIGFNMICGIVERNTALITQLVRMP